MVTQRILRVSQLRTATRHYLPVYSRAFSSKQRCVNFQNLNEATLISNDNVFTNANAAPQTEDADSFEPTIHGSEDVVTAGPVNRA
ncbi:hypothetical protein Cantr_01827 [Candida viswanathii]|uniref:Uncharacterized protein n=1 Tax=Candida viswanathii TaxID=5486 RepID=A0A367YJJ2_9ASCO|nr:hypothetical protein Cantr_01827 [Candida viswanathii]